MRLVDLLGQRGDQYFDRACPFRQAVALLAASDGTAKPLAGGQSLLPMMAFRLAAPTLLVDLRKLKELQKLTIDESGVRLGARVREKARSYTWAARGERLARVVRPLLERR